MPEKIIQIGGQQLTLRPVPAIGLQKIGERIRLIGSNASPEAIDALIDALWYGCRRAHPEVKRELFEWNIDTHNFHEMLEAFIAVNTPEGQSSGEVVAAASSPTGG